MNVLLYGNKRSFVFVIQAWWNYNKCIKKKKKKKVLTFAIYTPPNIGSMDLFRTHPNTQLFFFLQDGIPRTAYKGVVVFRFQTPRRIFLTAPDSLRQLGIQQT